MTSAIRRSAMPENGRLDARMREYGERFDHNLHALRIVEQFEQRYLDFPGLNLTFEVREGIIKHSRDYSAARKIPGTGGISARSNGRRSKRS